MAVGQPEEIWRRFRLLGHAASIGAAKLAAPLRQVISIEPKVDAADVVRA
jgi:hypothetical protein